MSQENILFRLVLDSSLFVQLVLALLLISSLISWSIILSGGFSLRRVRDSNDAFEKEFWSGRSLTELHQVAKQKASAAPMERVFSAGISEFLKLRERRLEPETLIEGARSAMRASLRRERRTMDAHAASLSAFASVGPLLGALGFFAFLAQSLADASSAQSMGFANFAPHLADALIIAALGVFVAIPARFFAHRYETGVKHVVWDLENFIDEFGNILIRNSHSSVQSMNPKKRREEDEAEKAEEPDKKE